MEWLLRADTPLEKIAVMFVAILLFAAVMALLLFVSDSLPKWAPAVGFLLPAGLMLIFGLLWPGLLTIRDSFYDKAGDTAVGFDNYVEVLTNPQFQTILVNTLVWTIAAPVLSTVFGLLYAALVDRTRFEKLAKTLVFLPMAISMVGAAIIWKFVYQYKPTEASQIGLINQFLVWLGIEPQQFLLNAPWNTAFLIVIMIWIQTGFAMTILSASIKAIPDEINEAAAIDGSTGMRTFFHVTIPSIRPALIVVLTTIAMATLKIFDIVRTATGGQFETSVIANEFYTQKFSAGDNGIAATLAVILFILVIPIVVYNVRQMQISETER
ncbi:MAG: ABC transporter permease [Propionibacterium sp.]|nr:MAG: ABC transporter permease [Propionibacterium sp.]